MRNRRKAVSLLLAVSLMLTTIVGGDGVQAAKKAAAKVSSVKITNAGKTLRLQKGKTFKLQTNVKVKPNKSKYKKIKFSSSNKKVVLVNSQGRLKGVQTGTAKITAASKVNPKKKATISVSVTKDVLVSSISLNKTKITADEYNEEEIPLKVTKILPANAKNKEVVWSTDDEKVADVDDDGVVTTGEVGTATITAKAADKGGAFATCRVVVTENKGQENDNSVKTENPPVQEQPGEIMPPADVPTQDPGQSEGAPSPEGSKETASPAPGDVTAEPTIAPTLKPTEEPTEAPTPKPTKEPTEAPTEVPTEEPTEVPTKVPTKTPTLKPTQPPKPTSTPIAWSGELSNPTIEDDADETWKIKTWDCVYFGNYWQNDTNGDGVADQNDEKQPIKWRVLSVDGDDAFLLADESLDCQPYNDEDTDVTWETCTLRSWLNDDFFTQAFTAEEQSAIRTTKAVNDANPDYGTEGGNDTLDKVYLLSIDEVLNSSYGFLGDHKNVYERSKVAKNTEYARGRGAYTDGSEYADYEDNGYWWLRSPGYSGNAVWVDDVGHVWQYGDRIDSNSVAVRPALHLNLSSASSLSYAGTVTVEEFNVLGLNPTKPPKPAWTPDPDKKVENVTLTYDYEFPGHRVVRFDGTVVNHEDEENANVEGYPAEGIDVRYYDKVIVKYEGGELRGDDDWYGKATLSSTDEGLGQNEYSDGLFSKYLEDVTYQDGVYIVEYDIDESSLHSYFDPEDVGLIDCISVQLANEDDYAGFKLKSIEFISSKNEPVVSETPTPPTPTPTPIEWSGELNNPKMENDADETWNIKTWDCVYFGNYWQNDTNGDGVADQNDEKQPIKWRVLSVDGDDAFLLADQNLDCQPYNDRYMSKNVTWETCTLRSWLNDDFFTQAFTAEEQSVIRTTKVVNDDNPAYDTEGGNDTLDNVYFLSIDEVLNPSYGFLGDHKNVYEKSKSSKNTEYATGQGAYTVGSEYTDCAGNGDWWLRSPGHDSGDGSYVDSNGHVYQSGTPVYRDSVAVRPALHLNLSSVSSWSYAGTVTVKEYNVVPEPTKPAWTPDPDKKVENVTLTYDYEFPGARMVRFDGTVVNHEDEENAKVEGYPADGINVRYYDKMIVKYEGNTWFGKVTLSSTNEWLWFDEYSDGIFYKWLDDVDAEGKYQDGVYTVEYDINKKSLTAGHYFEEVGLIDCISVCLDNEEEYAGFKLKSIEFISSKNEPSVSELPKTPTPTLPPVESATVETGIAEYGLNNPKINDDGITTWDSVYFGSYWQNDTNGDGKADENDEKQPIKWRVLSVVGDDAFLLADESLEGKAYNDEFKRVTWETCTLRSWLNDDFLAQAFTEEEQSAIRTTKVVNDRNHEYGTVGGNDTSDQVYLLSIDEMLNPAYGFSADYGEDAESRRSKNTEYAKEKGAYTDTSTEYADNGVWWLRSPGNVSNNASYVSSTGSMIRTGSSVDGSPMAVRPALHLNLSSASSWSYAGTVTSEKE